MSERGSWLDLLNLDPETEYYITQGARWLRTSREQFTAFCVLRYADTGEDVDPDASDPDLVQRAVKHYVTETIADMANAAEVFELK